MLPAPRFFPNHKSHRNLGSFVTTVRMGNLINIQDKYAKLCFPTTLKKLGRLYIHFLPSQKEEHYLISFRSDILSGRESSANKSATWHLPFGGLVVNKVLVLGQPAAANEEDDFIVTTTTKKKKKMRSKKSVQKWLRQVAVANVNSKTWWAFWVGFGWLGGNSQLKVTINAGGYV